MSSQVDGKLNFRAPPKRFLEANGTASSAAMGVDVTVEEVFGKNVRCVTKKWTVGSKPSARKDRDPNFTYSVAPSLLLGFKKSHARAPDPWNTFFCFDCVGKHDSCPKSSEEHSEVRFRESL